MISALIPARNASSTLDAALASLLSQTVQPGRVMVVDDGSTDGTAGVIAAWSRRWSAVETITLEPSGIGRALNAGLAACLRDTRTLWIMRMDADDRCDPRRLELQLAHARARDLALVGCEVRHAGEGTAGLTEGMERHVAWANSLHTHDELEQGLWFDSPLPHPGWLVRRVAFEQVGAYAECGEIPEDYDWLQRFFRSTSLRAGKPSGVKLLDWHDSPSRLTRTHGAYSEAAFHRVKARELARLLAAAGTREVHLFGLGPKGKALLPLLARERIPFTSIVDVHPRRVGNTYRGLEIWSLDQWKARAAPGRSFVIACVGTPEARERCAQVCEAQGLLPGRDFVTL